MSDVIRQLVGERTQIEIATKSGINPISLNRWYSGRIEPRYVDVVRIANVCGYEVKLIRKGDMND